MNDILNTGREQLRVLLEEAGGIWLAGGWAMVAIALIALVMFGLALHVHVRLRAKGLHAVPEETWRSWLERPEERRGSIGELLDSVTAGSGEAEQKARFEQVRVGETLPFERDLKVIRVCVGATPLVGLLGTVTGMLTTFGALASGSGGEKTMAMVAHGISEALITTETGLVIAIPGLFLQYRLSRSFARYRAFLAHLETVCTQRLQRHRSQAQRQVLRRAALRQARELLLERASARTRPHSGQATAGRGAQRGTSRPHAAARA